MRTASSSRPAPTPEDIGKEAIQNADIILLQLEIPITTVTAIIEDAVAYKKRIILNPAPARPLSDDLLKKITILTPNEREAELLTGIPVTNIETATAAARELQRRGVETVIITLGKNGALINEKNSLEILPAPEVTPLDTTAAGDVFNSALAVALAEGKAIKKAINFANHAAALSITAPGAQTSAPNRQQAEDFLKSPAR